uniref:ARAD1D33220p n=1 Tax=Blastobotrys adeninivorans TaxID=409370 RepID=A0A060TBM8_BLAAD
MSTQPQTYNDALAVLAVCDAMSSLDPSAALTSLPKAKHDPVLWSLNNKDEEWLINTKPKISIGSELTPEYPPPPPADYAEPFAAHLFLGSGVTAPSGHLTATARMAQNNGPIYAPGPSLSQPGTLPPNLTSVAARELAGLAPAPGAGGSSGAGGANGAAPGQTVTPATPAAGVNAQRPRIQRADPNAGTRHSTVQPSPGVVYKTEECPVCGRHFKGPKAATHKQQHIRRLHPQDYIPKRGGKKRVLPSPPQEKKEPQA